MSPNPVPRPPTPRLPRARYLLALDAAMLALVCVLEALSLTGLEWHEWLGFVLCLLVFFHVVLQWPWFLAEFRRLLTRGASRARVNSTLNYLLFIAMVAVLVSGVLISNPIAPLVGDALGRPKVWSELHSWLNFTLVVLVGLHLALNWDWILGAVRRRIVPLPRLPAVPAIIRRTAVVLLAACLVAALAYATMSALMNPREKSAPAQMATASQKPPPPRQGRPQFFRAGLQELDIAVLVVVFVAIVGRCVLRLRL